MARWRWLPLLIAVVIGFGPLPLALRVGTAAGSSGWIDAQGPAAIALAAVEQRFGRQDGFVVAVFADDVLTPDLLAWQQRVADGLAALPGIAAVDGLPTARDVVVDAMGPASVPLAEQDPADITSHPLYAGLLVARDGRAATLLARLTPAVDDAAAVALESRIRELLAAIPPPAGATALLGGLPAQQQAINRAVAADQRFTMPLVAVLLAAILVAVLRDWRLVLPALAAMGSALVWTFAALALAGRSLDALLGLLPPLIMGIGVATALHLVAAVGHELGAAEGSLRAAIRRTATPLLLATLTAIAGVAGLWWGAVPAVRAFAPWATLGVVFAAAFPFLWVPAAAPLVPERTWAALNRGWFGSALGGWLGRLADACQRWRVAVLVGYGLLAVVATVLCLHLRADADFVHALPDDDPVRVAHQRIDAQLTGALGLDLLIDLGHSPSATEAATAATLAAELRREPSVAHAITLGDVVALVRQRGDTRDGVAIIADLKLGARAVYERFVGSPLAGSSQEATTLRVMARQRDGSIAEAAAAARRGEQAARAAFPGATVVVASAALLLDETTTRLVPATANGLLASKVAIVVLLLLFLRTWRLALLAMVLTALPLLFTYAVIPALGWPLDVGISMIACIALGIIMNDAIHMAYALHRGSGSIAVAVAAVGPVLVAASLALSGAFSACALGGFTYTHRFGTLLALAFMIGLLVNLTLAPALLRRRMPP